MFTKKRLLIKIIIWRIIALIMTICIAFIETGNFRSSGLIGIINLIVKMLLLYMYELSWLKISYGIKETNEGPKEIKRRVCIKTTIWRFFSMLITFTISFIILRNIKEAVSISVIVMVVKTIVLYIYEFTWRKITWGKIEIETENV